MRSRFTLGIVLVPRHLEAAYIFLSSLEPIRGWKLPPAEEIAFRVIRSKAYRGFHVHTSMSAHEIQISSHCARYPDSLLKVVAHEMLHLKQRLHKEETHNTQHNMAFVKWGDRICAAFGWDPGLF
jgi:hypothetical protein